MKARCLVAVLIATAGLASIASADPVVRLVRTRTENLDGLCRSRYSTAAELISGVQYFIGNNPISVAYDGESLYVGGFLNGAFSSGGSSAAPQARMPDNTISDFGGGVINPTNGQTVTAGQPLTEVLDGSFVYWNTAMVRVKLNADGTRSFIANKYMRNAFYDANFAAGGDGSGIISTVVDGSRATSLDFSPSAGLLFAFDQPANAPGKVRRYTTTTQLNPILVTPSVAQQDIQNKRIIGGISWDFGADGNGYDYLAGGVLGNDGVKDGPVVAALQNPGGSNVNQYGPVGLDPATMKMNYTTGTPDFTNGIVYTGGIPSATPSPILPFNKGPLLGNAPSRILWRDICIHPTNGNIVARASNDLIYAYRNADGTTDPARTGRISSAIDGAFQVGQKCAIIYGVPGVPDLAVWNDVYAQGASDIFNQTYPFATLIKFNKLDGVVPPASAAIELLDEVPDGNGGVTRVPLTLNLTGAIADMHFHAPSNTLVVLEFTSRRATLFKVEPVTVAPPACLADINADGVVDGSDFVAFINSFAIGDTGIDAAADVNLDGVIDGNDFVAFINAFALGC